MKKLLSQAASRVWTPEQRRSLREAFQALVDAFADLVTVRGKRVTFTATPVNFTVSVEVPFKPASVTVVSTTQGTDGYVVTGLQYRWSYDGNTTVTLTDDGLFLVDGIEATFDVIMERGDG